MAFVVGLALTARRLALSRISCTAIFVLLSVHTVGAHYTYSEVPYDAWTRALDIGGEWSGHSEQEDLANYETKNSRVPRTRGDR